MTQGKDRVGLIVGLVLIGLGAGYALLSGFSSVFSLIGLIVAVLGLAMLFNTRKSKKVGNGHQELTK